MNKTIASLAILKVNWDELKRDYVENFVPFVATLISKKDYGTIEISTICKDFADEYGLIIPYHPMITILTRSKKRGLIRKDKGKFVPVREKIKEAEFSVASKEQIRKQEEVTNEFIDFCEKKYRAALTKEEAESAFVTFLKDHDLDILFAGQENATVLPETKRSRKHKFLVYSFLKSVCESKAHVFGFIADIAIGHALASALLYSEFDKFRGKLRAINFYFDTGFILRLLGTEGKQRKVANIEFLKILSGEGANLFVLRHTYEETMGILDNCLKWVENSDYDPLKASPALRYFIQNDYKASDVERLIVNVESTLAESGVRIADTPDPDQYRSYQIDEARLRQIIIDTYREYNPYFVEEEKDFTMQKDVNSISAIYRLRRGRSPRSIKEAGDIFVTTNSPLALANRRFELSEASKAIIPACLTDVFVGTLIWLESPTKVLAINEKKIMADCYAALQPDNVLIRKYLSEVEKLKREGKIREQEYYFLRAHRTAMNLLEEKTMGDPDAFTDKTTEEMLEEFKETIKKPEQQKYLEEKEKHTETRGELATTKVDIRTMKKNIEKRAQQVASIVGWICFGILFLLFTAGIVAQFLPSLLGDNKGLKVISILITILLGLMNVATGLNFKGLRGTVKRWIEDKVIQFFRGKTSETGLETDRKRSTDIK